MKKLTIHVSIALAFLSLTACMSSSNITEIEEPTHQAIRTHNSPRVQAMPEQKQSYFLGENKEIQCLGDLYAAYKTWDKEPYSPQNANTNISILPITNQTHYTDKEIPKELTLSAQKIASQLGIGHNILYIPSINEQLEGSQLYNSFSSYLTNIKEPNSIGVHGVKLPTNDTIFIVAALTEYDDPNKIFGQAVNSSVLGSVDKKSFGFGFNKDKNQFSGRMSMIFSIIYPAQNVGIFSTPQFIYHPDSTTTVTLDFKESVNENEFSVSYDGSKPSLGYRNKFQKRDSRFIASNLLLERGLLKVLGKYYKIPYWRCMTENLVASNNKQKPMPLKKSREMYGYDSHVEKTVRRLFRYKGNDFGLGPYINRPNKNVENGKVWALFASLTGNPDNNPFMPLKINTSGNFIVHEVDAQQFKAFHSKQCQPLMPKNDDATRYIALNYAEYNQCLAGLKLNDKNSSFQIPLNTIDEKIKLNGKVIAGHLNPGSTAPFFLNILKQVATFNVQTLSEEEQKAYAQYLYEINTSGLSEDNFVDLWMSLPYQADSRIYPHHLDWNAQNANLGQFIHKYEADISDGSQTTME